MLDPYVEALLVDEDLADQVWELWNARLVSDELAAWAWCILVFERPSTETANEIT